MPVRMDEKLFAHITDDAFLAGSFELEGSTFYSTAGFLNEYMGSLDEANLSPELLALQAALTKFSTLHALPLDCQPTIICEQVPKLKPGEYRLIPGGWRAVGGPGHGMVYEFFRDTNGDLLFSIYNAGAGLGFHRMNESKDKTLYDPVLTYRIPKIEQERASFSGWFKWYVEELLKPRDDGKHLRKKVDADWLYKEIFPEISYIGGTLDETLGETQKKQHKAWETGGQLSGTCAQRSLHQVLKTRFQNPDDYKRFMYRFKAYALDQYVKQLKQDGELYASHRRELLERGIKHNISLLNRELENNTPLFGTDFKKQELARLNGYLSELRQASTHTQPRSQTSSTYPQAYVQILPRSMQETITPAEETKKGGAIVQEFTPVNSVNDFEQVVNRLMYLVENKEDYLVIQEFERTILTDFPLPKNITDPLLSFYDGLKSPEQFNVFRERMEALQHTYRIYCSYLAHASRENNDILMLSRYFIIRNKISAILTHVYINQHHGEGKIPEFLHYYVCGYLEEMESTNNPYLATNSPEMDSHYLESQKIWAAHHPVTQFTALQVEEQCIKEIQFYQSLIEKIPGMVEHLTMLFEIGAEGKDRVLLKKIRDMGCEAAYYWLNIVDSWNSPGSVLEYSLSKLEVHPLKMMVENPEALANQLKNKSGFIFFNSDLYYVDLTQRTVDPIKVDYNHYRYECYFHLKSRLEGPATKASIKEYEDGVMSLIPPQKLKIETIKIEKLIEKMNIPFKDRLQFYQTLHKDFETLTAQFNEQFKFETTAFGDRKYSTWDYFLDCGLLRHNTNVFPLLAEGIEKSKYLSMQGMHLLNKTYTIANDSKESHADNIIALNIPFKEREKYLLRLVPETQIPLTLTYYKNHISLLSQRKEQDYLEANLFQPGLLLELLKTDYRDQFFNQFDKFIEDALCIYQRNGQLTQNGLFFIRLKCLVYRYAAAVDKHKYRPRLVQFAQQLDEAIATSKNESIKASLHQYLLMTNDALLSLFPEESNDRLETSLQALFLTNISMNPEHPLDPDSVFQLACSKEALKKCLAKKTDAELHDLLRSIARKFNLNLPDGCSVQGGFPRYTIKQKDKTYQFDLKEGLIYFDGLSYGLMPSWLVKNPLLKKLGLSHLQYCFYSADGKKVTLQHPPVEICFLKETWVSGYRIQMKGLPGFPENEWYELAALSPEQQESLSLQKLDRIKSNLPKTICDINTLAFVSMDPRQPRQLILTRNDQPICYGTKLNDTAQLEIRHFSDNRLLCQLNPTLHAFFCQFEGEQFISEWRTDSQDEPYTIELARYGLRFTANQAQDKLFWQSEQGISYQVQQQTMPMDSGIAQVTLTDAHGQTYCLLPIQRFLAENRRSLNSPYHQFTLDRSNVIPNHVLYLQPKIDSKAQPEEKREPSEEKSLNRMWQHESSQQMFLFKMEEGEPVPETPAQALYLCYLYLGSHQPEKAWKILEICDKRLGGLVGTYEEIRYMHWIINALPYVLNSSDEECKVSSPQVVSCQLKALSLMTRLRWQDKVIDYPKSTFPKDTLNYNYETNEVENTRTFYDEASKDIYTLYTKLQQGRRELPIEFALSDTECFNLLDEYHSKSNGISGALGYEYVQLQLKQLRQEYLHYQAKQPEGLSVYEKKRMNEIERYLQAYSQIAMHHSDIIYRNLDLDLHVSHLNKAILSKESQSMVEEGYCYAGICFQPNSNICIQAMNHLHPGITEDDFIKYLPGYLYIAQTKNAPNREQLRYFCEKTLIANRHTPLNQKASNIPLLCNALYRILCHDNPTELLEMVRQNSQFFDKVRQMEPDPIRIPEISPIPETLIHTKTLFEQTQIMVKPVPVELKQTIPIPSFYHWVEEQFKTELNRWNEAEISLHEKNVLNESQDFLHSAESQKGQMDFKLFCAKKAIAQTFFKDLEPYEEKLAEYCVLRTNEQNKFKNQALTLAQSKLEVSEQANIAANKRPDLDINRLLTLYFHHDLVQYREETHLDDGEIEKLHELLAQYVASEIDLKQTERVISSIKNLKDADDNMLEQRRFELAKALFTKNLIDPRHDPDLSVFQYHGKMLFRPQQVNTIQTLMSQSEDGRFPELVEKIIMGGGKSKIILPTLAQKKAHGENLVIVEVPSQSLQINYEDLRATSWELYKQDVFKFEFNRDSDCSPERLKRLYNDFQRAMRQKSYMVTAGESLQSLEEKYLELLNSKPLDVERWQQQIYYMDNLIAMLRYRGDLIIDEVHQGLALKKQLNYSLGEPQFVSKSMTNSVLDLYQFFKHVNILPNGKTLYDVVTNKIVLTKEAELIAASEALTLALVNHINSPLQELIQCFKENNPGRDIKAELADYLSNRGQIIPDFILSATTLQKEHIAIYKAEVSQLLRYTLGRRLGENYGPSKLADKDPVLSAIAIPYAANNKPNEHSRFGNPLETINFTIQSMCCTGIPENLLKKMILDWQEKSRLEMTQLMCDVNNTPTANYVNKLIKDKNIKLDNIDLTNTEIVKKLCHDERLIDEVLRNVVLNSIEDESDILHSDAYAHVDIVHTCQGFSGTPSNHTTFHERLSYHTAGTLGTDGYVIAGIRAKSPSVTGLDFENTKQYIENLFAIERPNTRALIDISATFKGIDNHQVARALANYIDQHPEKFIQKPQRLKYVIFFDEKDRLVALPISADSATRTPLQLGSSDPDTIQKALGCSPEACFTFYDQSHTVGADIKQADDARALVLIAQTTQLQHFLQGSMRMRGLVEGKQQIDLIVPKELENQSLDALVESMFQTEKNQLEIDNYFAARAKMTNCIRANLMQQIVQVDSQHAQYKAQLLHFFEPFFIEKRGNDVFKRYGGIYQQEDTQSILSNHRDHLLQEWVDLQSKAGIEVSTQQQEAMKGKLNAILEKSIKHCAQKTLNSHGTQGLQVEQEQLQQKQQEIMVEQENVAYEMNDRGKKDPSKYIPWSLDAFIKSKRQKDALSFKTLSEICRYVGSGHGVIPLDLDFQFDETIRASKNFYETYPCQTGYINEHMKPVHALLFQQEENGALKCTLLTQQECAEIRPLLSQKESLCTTDGEPLPGSQGKVPTEHPQFQRIIEQVRFFNGELAPLVSNPKGRSWLHEYTAQKIAYFENYLLPHHPDQSAYLQQLSKMNQHSQPIVRFIMANLPLESIEPLKQQFPEFEDADYEVFHKAALSLHRIIKEWSKPHFTNNDWQHEFQSNVFLGHFKRSIDQLVGLKTHIETIQTRMTKKPIADLIHDFEALKTINYQLLVSLIKENPSLKEHRGMLFVLAMHPELNGSYLQAIVNASENDPLIYAALLSNIQPNSKVTKTQFDQLLQKGINHKEILLAAARHPLLCDANVTSLLKSSKWNKASITLALFANKNLSATTLISLIPKAGLTEKHVHAIISREEGVSEAFLKAFIGKANSGNGNRLLLGAYAKTANSKETLQSILNNPLTDAHVLGNVINNPFVTEEMLKAIASRTTNSLDVLLELFKNPKSDTETLQATAEAMLTYIETSCQFGKYDPKILRFVTYQREYMKSHTSHMDILSIKGWILKTLKAVDSPQVRLLKAEIDRLKKSWILIGKDKKINEIISAIQYIELDERADFTSGNHRDLLNALASHRLHNKEYHMEENDSDRINPKKAAKAYSNFFKGVENLEKEKMLIEAKVGRNKPK